MAVGPAQFALRRHRRPSLMAAPPCRASYSVSCDWMVIVTTSNVPATTTVCVRHSWRCANNSSPSSRPERGPRNSVSIGVSPVSVVNESHDSHWGCLRAYLAYAGPPRAVRIVGRAVSSCVRTGDFEQSQLSAFASPRQRMRTARGGFATVGLVDASV